MRNFFLAAALAAVTVGPVWAQNPDDLLERWLRSTPEKRAAAHELMLERYPDLATELRTFLAARYPGFELKAARALVTFREAHPGLLAAVARQLLEDLGGEPADALLDVAEAVTARYPGLPRRLLELRRSQGPGMRLRELVAGRYPHLRTEVLQLLSAHPPGALRESLAAVRARHPGLRWAVLLEVSRLADERFPGLTREFLTARRQGARPLPWLLENHPEFVREAARRIHTAQGEKLRRAAVDLLAEMEKRQRERTPGLAQQILQLVESRYPELPGQALTSRLQAAREFRSALRQEFPDLLTLTAQTLQKEHPRLLARAADSVRQHFPNLRTELWQALENELPGLRQEVKDHLSKTHPDLHKELDRIL